MKVSIDGIFNIAIGLFCFLVASGNVQVSKDPEKGALWLQKYGKLIKICGVFLLIFGIIQLFRP